MRQISSTFAFALQLSIPSCKDSKEDSWKFGGSNKSSSALNRIDSCLDSGRGSSLGYSSDTFSPLSSASAGSRGSPQSVQDNETRKIWDDKIWAAPAESSKLVCFIMLSSKLILMDSPWLVNLYA